MTGLRMVRPPLEYARELPANRTSWIVSVRLIVSSFLSAAEPLHGVSIDVVGDRLAHRRR